MASPPTGTVTFLFTDIEGSTKIWENNAPAMQSALARHDELLRRAIEERGGYVFKTVGDAFCWAFLTAPDALECALETQRRLLSSEWEQIGTLRVRMALHTGAAEERDRDYFGPPVNRVARLLSAGHGGQVLLSLPTQELVRDHLPPLELMLGGWRRVHINGTVGLNGVEARYQSISWTAGDSRGLLETYSSSFNYLSHPKSTYIASAIEGAYAQSAIGPSSREGEVAMPTITVEKSVTIDRPADQVWRFLSDENSAIKWQQSLHSHRTEGNTAHQVRKFGGHQMEMHHDVQNDHQGRIRSFQGQINTNFGVHEYEGQFTVTPAGDSASIVTTRVVWHLVHLSAEGAQAMENILGPAIEGDLMTLKPLLEAPPEFHQHLQQAHPVWESSS